MFYETLRNQKWFKDTNAAWNKSGVNHPDNVGYLFNAIQTLEPKTFDEWENYFKAAIANDEKIQEYALIFKDTVLKSSDLNKSFYEKIPITDYIKATECRLIYETWLGYQSEIFVIEEILKQFPDLHAIHMSPEDDNKYAVDYILALNNKKLCGIQVKSINYRDSTRPILQKTRAINKKKNDMFTKKTSLPVFYAYYNRQHNELNFIDDNCIKQIKALI